MRQHARKEADPECVAHATVGRAFAQSLQQHHVQAVTTYRRAIALFTTLKKREDAARAEIGLSQALTGSGDYVGALAAARHAAKRRHRDRCGRCGVAGAGGGCAGPAPLDECRRRHWLPRRKPSAVWKRSRERALDGLDRSAVRRQHRCVRVARGAAGGSQRCAGAFATLERRRAHALRLELARNERDIARGMTQAERDRERQSAAEIATVRAQLDHERALPKPDAARIERLQQRLSAAVQQRSADRAELFARVPELSVWRGLQPAIMLTDTVSHLVGRRGPRRIRHR